jgi:hypothetical protein
MNRDPAACPLQDQAKRPSPYISLACPNYYHIVQRLARTPTSVTPAPYAVHACRVPEVGANVYAKLLVGLGEPLMDTVASSCCPFFNGGGLDDEVLVGV